MWWIVPMVVFGGLVMLVIWSCFAAASRADNADEEIRRIIDSLPPSEPRCDITGQPLTTQEQYDRDCL